MPYFRNNFYRSQESQEKHLHDLSHTSREVSILSGCVSISSAEPVATEVTEGCVLQFGTRPNITFENVHFCIYSEKKNKKTKNKIHSYNSYAFFFVIKNLYLMPAPSGRDQSAVHDICEEKGQKGKPRKAEWFPCIPLTLSNALPFCFFYSWNQVND